MMGKSDDSNEIGSWDRGEFQLKVGSLEPVSLGVVSHLDLGINPTRRFIPKYERLCTEVTGRTTGVSRQSFPKKRLTCVYDLTLDEQ
jgi:hypothetical protein